MGNAPVAESMLAIMLSVGFLAAAALAVACYRRPMTRRGDALGSFLMAAGLGLIELSAGFWVATMVSAGYATLGGYGPGFLLLIFIALIAAAVYTFRRRDRS